MKPEQSTIHILRANLGRWLGPQLPDEVVRADVEHLRGDDTAGRLRLDGEPGGIGSRLAGEEAQETSHV
jgi:hypothetical protein